MYVGCAKKITGTDWLGRQGDVTNDQAKYGFVSVSFPATCCARSGQYTTN